MSSLTSTPGSAPKAMSSRLLTMKFMQRAAASPTTPTTPEEPSPKRRKKDSDSPSRPAFNVNALADQRAVRAALEAEEAKRQAALERAAAEAGDTRWVLSFEDQQNLEGHNPALRVVQAGYANLDEISSPSNDRFEDNESGWDDQPVIVGRRSYGKFNKALEKQQDPSKEDSSESDSDDEEDGESQDDSGDDSEDDPTMQMIKAERQQAILQAKATRKSKKKAEKKESAKLAEQRKRKEVNINGLTSLNGRVNTTSCFKCGGPHKKADCPNLKRGYDGPHEGRSKKPRKSY